MTQESESSPLHPDGISSRVDIGTPSRQPRKKRNSMVLSSHVGSLVGSSGRQGFADFMRPRADQVRTLIDVENVHNSTAIDDGDGGLLDSGLGARTEVDRILHEREDLLRDNHRLGPGPRSPRLVGNYGTTTLPAERADRPRPTNRAEEIEDAWEEAVLEGTIQTRATRELRVLIENSIPLAITFFLQYSLVVASIFSVGHLGRAELGAVSLGSMTANITGFAMIQGLATCLDTLCAQAYGAGRLDLVGMYFQKCVVMTLLCFAPVWLVWFRSDKILELILPEDEDVLIPMARQYLLIVATGIPGYTLFECGKRFLQAQGIYHASTMVLCICAPINIFLNYLFVWNAAFGIGFPGAPLAVAVTDWLMAILLGLYVIFIDGKDSWNGFTWDIFKEWGPMVKLAIPGVVMVEAEFWAFEALTLASSRLGTAVLAAQSVLGSLTALVYQIPFAFAIAASTRVANFVGAGLKGPAQLTSTVAMGASFVLSAVDSVLLYAFKYELAGLFSNDEEVVDLVAKAFGICAIMHVFDGMAAVAGGVLRGQGRQETGGYLNLAAYYLIGVPLAVLFAFKLDMGLTGLWAGVTMGLIALAGSSIIVILRTNWDAVILKSKESLV